MGDFFENAPDIYINSSSSSCIANCRPYLFPQTSAFELAAPWGSSRGLSSLPLLRLQPVTLSLTAQEQPRCRHSPKDTVFSHVHPPERGFKTKHFCLSRQRPFTILKSLHHPEVPSVPCTHLRGESTPSNTGSRFSVILLPNC